MPAYATRQHENSTRLHMLEERLPQKRFVRDVAGSAPFAKAHDRGINEASVMDALLDRLVDRLAAAVAARIGREAAGTKGDWLDSREAAEYLGLHRDTLRRLAAARAIPAEQDGRGCKLYFRRAALDDWRQAGGPKRRLAVVADAA